MQHARALTRALGAALGALACALVFAAPALASDFRWTGLDTSGSWSSALNWQGPSAPSGTVGTLTFPNLGSCVTTCLTSTNDVAGISASTLSIDTGSSYTISGNQITLTSGITMPGSGSGTNTLTLPIALGGPNAWSITGPLSVGGQISGVYTLGVTFSNGAPLTLGADDELGAVTLSGQDTTQSGANASGNGILGLNNATLNGDGNAVNLSDAELRGSGTVGALTSSGGDLEVGSAGAGKLTLAGNLSLDAASATGFAIKSAGTTPGADFGQLDAGGHALSLGGALAVSMPSCPSLNVGDTYTLVQGASSINGTFSNAPDGAVIQTTGSCSPQVQLQIHYASDSVTATVVAKPVSISPPTLSGSATQGQTLVETHGAWSNSPNPNGYTYQWLRCDSAGNGCGTIGASGRSYVLQQPDAGHTIRVEEFASNVAGTSDPATSAPSALVASPPPVPTPPLLQTPPIVSGAPVGGGLLSTSVGTWGGSPTIVYMYQWQRCSPTCTNISGADAPWYAPTGLDVGERVRAVIIASNPAGGAFATSGEVGPVAVAARQLKFLLLTAIAPSGKAASIGSILKHGGATLSFNAPSAGRAVVGWYYLPAGAHIAGAHSKATLVATGQLTFTGPRSDRLALKLTPSGRRLLVRGRQLKLTAQGSFAPPLQRPVVATRTFNVKR